MIALKRWKPVEEFLVAYYLVSLTAPEFPASPTGAQSSEDQERSGLVDI